MSTEVPDTPTAPADDAAARHEADEPLRFDDSAAVELEECR